MAGTLKALLADPEFRALVSGSGVQAPPAPPRVPLPPPDPRVPAHLQPVRIDSSREAAPVVYDDPVFYLDGVPWCKPSDPPPHWATEYLADMAEGNPLKAAKAEITMYERMLGQDGWETLRSCAESGKIGMAEYRKVITIISTGLLGRADEDPKGG